MWVLAAVGAVIVLTVTPVDGDLTWFPIALAASTLAAFGIQLAIQRKEGFVTRVMASITGAVVLLGVATVVAVVVA